MREFEPVVRQELVGNVLCCGDGNEESHKTKAPNCTPTGDGRTALGRHIRLRGHMVPVSLVGFIPIINWFQQWHMRAGSYC